MPLEVSLVFVKTKIELLFKGNYGENVFKFKEEIVSAIRDSQVKKADEVRILLTLSI